MSRDLYIRITYGEGEGEGRERGGGRGGEEILET